MSTCPDKDIHSIYLDNELPGKYAKEYEKHVSSCPKCQSALEQLKRTRNLLHADSDSLQLDSVFLQQSFDRLQSRLRYTKVISKSENRRTVKFPEVKKYIPAAVAAAAVFAVMIPLNLRTKQEAFKSAALAAHIQPITRTTDFSLNQSQMLTETSNVAYPLPLSQKSTYQSDNFTLNSFSPYTLKTAEVVSTRKPQSRQRNVSNLLNNDFFMPEFIVSEPQSTALQIYMPSYVDISALNK